MQNGRKNNIIDRQIFAFKLYSDNKKSHYFDLEKPIIKVINTTHLPIKRLHRVKANLTSLILKLLQLNKDTQEPIHTDIRRKLLFINLLCK